MPDPAPNGTVVVPNAPGFHAKYGEWLRWAFILLILLFGKYLGINVSQLLGP